MLSFFRPSRYFAHDSDDPTFQPRPWPDRVFVFALKITIVRRILAGSILLACFSAQGEPPNPKIAEAHLKADVAVGAEEPVLALANCRTTPQRG